MIPMRRPYGKSADYYDAFYTERVDYDGDVRFLQQVFKVHGLPKTKRVLDLDALLSEDSTFYGDLFAHVVEWRGELYLEDGLHRALRAALHQRAVLHARVLVVG